MICKSMEFVRECARGEYPDTDPDSMLEWVTERARAILRELPAQQDRDSILQEADNDL